MEGGAVPWRCLTIWTNRKVPPAKIRANGQMRSGAYCGLRGRGVCLSEKKREAEENWREREREKGLEELGAGRWKGPVEIIVGLDWGGVNGGERDCPAMKRLGSIRPSARRRKGPPATSSLATRCHPPVTLSICPFDPSYDRAIPRAARRPAFARCGWEAT